MAAILHKDIGDVWQPQASFTVADVDTDPTLLVVRVMDPDGNETTQIENSPQGLTPIDTPVARAGAGVYIFQQQLDKAGHWYCRFEGTGAVEASEDHEVIVDPTPFYDAAGIWTRALVDLGSTKDWLGVKQVDTSRDLKIVQRINAASKRIMEVSGREFRSETGAAVAERTFDMYGSTGVTYIGDLATLTGSSATFSDLDTGTVTQTLATTDYVGLPRNRSADEPITALRFLSTAAWNGGRSVLSFTGVWGFPSVPEDVKHATMDTVAFWLDRDVEHFRQDLGAVPGASEGGQTVIVGSAPTVLPLPPEAFSIAKSYKSMLVV